MGPGFESLASHIEHHPTGGVLFYILLGLEDVNITARWAVIRPRLDGDDTIRCAFRHIGNESLASHKEHHPTGGVLFYVLLGLEDRNADIRWCNSILCQIPVCRAVNKYGCRGDHWSPGGEMFHYRTDSGEFVAAMFAGDRWSPLHRI